MRYADLHLHSTYSDGTMTVRELCDSAVAHGVSVIAITDHNCVGGVLEALEYAKELPLTVIPGVEIDAQFGDRVYHILGLNNSQLSMPRSFTRAPNFHIAD